MQLTNWGWIIEILVYFIHTLTVREIDASSDDDDFYVIYFNVYLLYKKMHFFLLHKYEHGTYKQSGHISRYCKNIQLIRRMNEDVHQWHFFNMASVLFILNWTSTSVNDREKKTQVQRNFNWFLFVPQQKSQFSR